jgi:hypothetical protein
VFDTGLHPPHADLALEYLTIARGLRTHTAWSGVKGHLFKLLRPALAAHPDLRARLGQMRKDDFAAAEAICAEMKKRMDVRMLSVLSAGWGLTGYSEIYSRPRTAHLPSSSSTRLRMTAMGRTQPAARPFHTGSLSRTGAPTHLPRQKLTLA